MKPVPLVLLGFILGCSSPPPEADQASRSEDRMTWWRDAHFGMFVHWGLYSMLGGEWEGFDYGREMDDASAEWIMLSADIPKGDHPALSLQFNPTKFDASKWISVAKQAGMKYFIITSKHHDSFRFFDTGHSEYDVIDNSPFKRDIIRELADECARQGIVFGVYYSHNKDWGITASNAAPIPIPQRLST